MSIARCSKTARVAGVAAWRALGKGSAVWQVWCRYKNISPGFFTSPGTSRKALPLSSRLQLRNKASVMFIARPTNAEVFSASIKVRCSPKHIGGHLYVAGYISINRQVLNVALPHDITFSEHH